MNIKTLTVSLLFVSCALTGCVSQPPAGASADRSRTPEALPLSDAQREPLFDTYIEFASVNSTWLDMYATQPFLNATPEQIAATMRPIESTDQKLAAQIDEAPGAETDDEQAATADQVANAE